MRIPYAVKAEAIKIPEVDVVAICDVYRDKAESGRDIVKKKRDCDCKVYTDHKELLADEEINTVVGGGYSIEDT